MLEVTLIARPQLVLPRDMIEAASENQIKGTDAECLVEVAGRICYDSLGKGRGSEAYHAHILEVGHGSVEEHAQFSFRIRGVSRALTHELVRHRVGVAISQRSTRYVDESEAYVVRHPAAAALSDATVAEAERAIRSARFAYQLIADDVEAGLLANGVDKATARKQARGAARLILPNGIETELIWSANIRTLRHVVEMRADDAADAEIRALGIALLGIMQVEAPAYFKGYEVVEAADGIGLVVRKDAPRTPKVVRVTADGPWTPVKK